MDERDSVCLGAADGGLADKDSNIWRALIPEGVDGSCGSGGDEMTGGCIREGELGSTVSTAIEERRLSEALCELMLETDALARIFTDADEGCLGDLSPSSSPPTAHEV